MNDPLPAFIVQLIFLIIAALCTGARAAIGRVNDYNMEELAHSGDRQAKRIIKIMEREAKVISALRMANVAFIAAVASIGVYVYTPLVCKTAENEIWAFSAVLLIHIALIVTFGEMIPRKMCSANPDKCAMALSGLVIFVSNVLRPFVFILNFISKVIVVLFGGDPNGESEKVTEDDVMMMVDLGSEKGTIAPEEKELITNIFEFGDMCADDVMTHRKDVAVLMMDETAEEWEKTIRESGFSRFPVCGEDIDDIVGVVYARELYEFFYDKGEDVKEIIHQAYVVPEKIGADLLFENMQKEKTHFAIVADEYGGFAGIVTMDDLLGCIVGEIEDEEYDEEEEEEIEDVVCIGDKVWDVDGLTPLDELAEITGADLPVDEFDTLSGLVLDAIEYIPDDGTTVKVITCGLEIEATEIKDRRIVRATVKVLPDENIDD